MTWTMEDGLLVLFGLVIIAPITALRNVKLNNDIERFASSFEYSPTPQFLKGASGKIVALNRAFTDAFGLTIKDYEGTDIYMQHAFWTSNNIGPIAFLETDRVAYATDDVTFSVEMLIPPKPERSILPRPYEPKEYYVAKRRFPIRTLMGTTKYGLIGSCMSLDLLLLYADRARIHHEEAVAKSPMLSAIHSLSKDVTAGFDAIDKKLVDVQSTLRTHQEDIDHLLGTATSIEDSISNEAITRRTPPNTAKQFANFVNPEGEG